jgi:uncharacterized protein
MKTIPLAQVRRHDRAVEDPAWIRALLSRAPIATLATSSDGQPFVNINLFVFDPGAEVIYFHTSNKGLTRTKIENNPRVCLSVAEMGRLLPAETALDMSVEYASVVVFGRATVVADSEEATRALQLLLAKYFPHLEYGKDYRGIQPDELARTAVYRIEIESWSGKRKRVAEDFPGAFWYHQPSGNDDE